MVVQSIATKGTKQRSQARKLIASSVQPAQHILDASIDFSDDYRLGKPLIHKAGPYGDLFFIQSAKFTTRYYYAKWNNDRSCWQCSCPQGCRTHEHTRTINAYIESRKDKIA